MTDQALLDISRACGFDHAALLNVAALEFNPAVRAMCAADRCRSYGKSWACPPACGELEEIAKHAATYKRGVIVQTTGILQDDFDVDAMQETEQTQKERFLALVSIVRQEYPSCLPMSSGACTVCPDCTYPNSPCRFPHLCVPSMEAYGLIVSKTCENSGLSYYYGPKTITYTACILVE